MCIKVGDSLVCSLLQLIKMKMMYSVNKSKSCRIFTKFNMKIPIKTTIYLMVIVAHNGTGSDFFFFFSFALLSSDTVTMLFYPKLVECFFSFIYLCSE